MSQRILTQELIRDGQCTPWGFRLAGGVDIGTPLVIQRVSFGSPAEGELQKGDMILSIAGQDARKISHQRATDLIAKAGNNLKLVVARSAYSSSTGSSPTMSPTPPLSLLQQGNPDYMKPLPRTQFQGDARSRTSQSYQQQDEKAAITSQAYRTLPLITPDLKASKDLPIGSYLRFSRDTSGKSSTSKTNDPFMLSKVQEAILEAALSSPRASISSSRTSTPDIGYQNVSLRQYNSPINLYSHQALVETLNAQTSATKTINELPRVQSPERPPLDICKSPTYQLIQEEEHMSLNKQKLEEQQPVKTKVHDLHEVPKAVFAESHETIQQSGSFKVLMATMKSTPGV